VFCAGIETSGKAISIKPTFAFPVLLLVSTDCQIPFTYWISVVNDDKSTAKIAEVVECSVPYNRAGGKHGLTDTDPVFHVRRGLFACEDTVAETLNGFTRFYEIRF
jgi:hypothetical protein